MNILPIHRAVRTACLAAICHIGWLAAPSAHGAGQVTLGDLFNSARKALAGPSAAEPQPQPTVQAAQDPEQAQFQHALQAYIATIKELELRKNLPEHAWKQTYLLDRPELQAYTKTAFSGMWALRQVRPQDEETLQWWLKSLGVLYEYQPIVMFTKDGSGFIVRKENFAKGSEGWIVYDKAKGYVTGMNAQPYIQQLLASMDTTPLPGVGGGEPTFILYTSPSCPYSEKVEPLLEKSGMSFRIFPTYTINQGDDYPAVHRVFCATNKLDAFKQALADKGRERAEFKRTGKLKRPNNDDDWYCRRDIMPNVLLRDIDFIFGQGYSTPSFYFADGSVIVGVDKLEAVRAKSKEMEAKGLYFK